MPVDVLEVSREEGFALAPGLGVGVEVGDAGQVVEGLCYGGLVSTWCTRSGVS